MKKRTRQLQFDTQTKQKIYLREKGQCLFCQRNYHMKCWDEYQYKIKDIMHYINKSAGGLGIMENGVLGCRYHHSLLDNGNKGLRPEMLEIMKEYLKSKHPEWDESKLVYKKYNF